MILQEKRFGYVKLGLTLQFFLRSLAFFTKKIVNLQREIKT